MDIRLHPPNHHTVWQKQQSVLTRRLEVLRALADLWEEASYCTEPGVTQRSHPLASPRTGNTLLSCKENMKSKLKEGGEIFISVHEVS